MKTAWVVALVTLFALAPLTPGQEKKKDPPKGKRNYEAMDYGPFLAASYAIKTPANNNVYRGLFVGFEIPENGTIFDAQAGYIFDEEMLRPAAFWTGGSVKLDGVVFSGGHGANPSPVGTILLSTKPTPGWANDGSWKDPREVQHGPLPRSWARYKGHYRHEKGTVLSYTVGDGKVLELPALEQSDNYKYLSRTLNFKSANKAAAMAVADVDGGEVRGIKDLAIVTKGDTVTAVKALGLEGASFEYTEGRLALKLPAVNAGAKVKVIVWVGPRDEQGEALAAMAKLKGPADLTPLTQGGTARWAKDVITKGTVGETKSKDPKAKSDPAYVIDSITPPFQNPYGAWMRIGGFDFFSDGRAAVCTWSGDVWIVSGIDDKLENVTWKRYAAGIFQALGLKIVNDEVYVLGRDMITRLHDLNKDGEADFHECFNNDYMVTMNFHEFIFDLHTDPEGNFYFIKGGPVRPGGSGWDKITPHHGCIFKISRDGSKLDVVARGFRAPNGMGVSPTGQITCGDNEGTWTPMCPLNWIKSGGFYGVPEFSKRDPLPVVRDNPLCWFPKNIDNSNGGQAWISGDKFGPLSGQLMHTSYGTCTMYLVMKEEVAGQMQGGVVPILKFDSGVCRARFNDKQNALFLTGLRGWQTNASKDAGFYRVRYTGKPLNLPVGLNVSPGTIKLTFSDALDTTLATEPDNYRIDVWNYKWTKNYGSQHYKVFPPKKKTENPSDPKVKKGNDKESDLKGSDELEIESATVGNDGKTVTLKVPDLQPVMQMKITLNLKAADGTPIRTSVHNTINVIGNRRGEVHVGEYKIVENK